MGLVTLDVRQESTKHAAAMNAITEYLGLGSYLDWDEARRQEFLTAELNSRRPLLPAGAVACSFLLPPPGNLHPAWPHHLPAHLRSGTVLADCSRYNL